ncbi:MAG: flavodoxin domain-containing protein [Anaerolineaceae bacterium]
MKKILVVYKTNSGSTAEIAQAIAEELRSKSLDVEVKSIDKAVDLTPFQGVVIGAPMIMGWHRDAVNFINKNQAVLSGKKVAYFLAAMSLTDLPDPFGGRLPLTLDPNLVAAPKKPRRLSFKENFATVANYLKPVLKAAPSVNPISVAFVGGKLELFRLKWYAMLFVMIVIQASPRDLRNWPFIKEWAGSLAGKFNAD